MIPTIEEIRGFLGELGFKEKTTNEFIEQIKHFEEEAQNRDEIVKEYLKNDCIDKIVEEIVGDILTLNKKNVTMLDVAAGSGFFTSKIKERLGEEGVQAKIYGFDITPSMLERLEEKKITPIWGIAEKIKESIEIANKCSNSDFPEMFDGVISTLAFHHSLNPENVLKSMRNVVKEGGKTVIIDVLKHEHREFRETLKDTYLGFTLDEMRELASNIFEEVKVKRMDIYCEVHGKTAGFFKAVFS